MIWFAMASLILVLGCLMLLGSYGAFHDLIKKVSIRDFETEALLKQRYFRARGQIYKGFSVVALGNVFLALGILQLRTFRRLSWCLLVIALLLFCLCVFISI
jgi:hypothetical protein